MADFVAELTEVELPKEYSSYSNWIMYFDGSKVLAGLGAGVILTPPTGDTVCYVLQIMYADSNKESNMRHCFMVPRWLSPWVYIA